jgi:hypothetical protein
MLNLLSKAKAYVKAHLDHFLISIGVSLVITVITNVCMHYLPAILRFLHIPAKLIHLVTGN